LRKYLKYALLVGILSFPLFGLLDALPIRIWDESRLANSALEMYESGLQLTTTYEGSQDLYSTKPPLMIWLQVVCMQVVGPNELAVRLPSAIAGFICCLALMLFLKRNSNNFWLGFAGAVTLVGMPGFVGEHVCRTGDYDALLVLFLTLSALCIYQFSKHKSSKWIYLFFLSTFLAFFTKSTAGLLFIPGVILFLLSQKVLLKFLKKRAFYIGLFGSVVLAAGYFVAREKLGPGYWEAVWQNDVTGRYNEVLENHRGGFWFYYNFLVSSHLGFLYLLVPVGWVIGLSNKNETIYRLTVLSLCISISYFLIISTAQTKLEWYTAPLLPFLAINIAIVIDFVMKMLSKLKTGKYLRKNVLPYVVLFLFLITPYKGMIDSIYSPEDVVWEREFYEPGQWLRQHIKHGDHSTALDILQTDYRPHWRFYVKQGQLQGIPIRCIDKNEILSSKNLLVFRDENQALLEANYSFDLLEDTYMLKRYTNIQLDSTSIK
jgi:4-amino-4-deoxy-L-arabinose transferase-like glycosyltransferase